MSLALSLMSVDLKYHFLPWGRGGWSTFWVSHCPLLLQWDRHDQDQQHHQPQQLHCLPGGLVVEVVGVLMWGMIWMMEVVVVVLTVGEDWVAHSVVVVVVVVGGCNLYCCGLVVVVVAVDTMVVVTLKVLTLEGLGWSSPKEIDLSHNKSNNAGCFICGEL